MCLMSKPYKKKEIAIYFIILKPVCIVVTNTFISFLCFIWYIFPDILILNMALKQRLKTKLNGLSSFIKMHFFVEVFEEMCVWKLMDCRRLGLCPRIKKTDFK